MRPGLLAVDDDPEVLRAVDRDLRRRYADRYRVVRAESGASAIDALRRFEERGDPIALVVADQRMPEMTGVELLQQTMKLVPDAKRVLLTAYADTDAAIDAINKARIDNYLTKPWDPDQLYLSLDELLDDWQSSFVAPFEGIHVIGHRWSPKSHDVRDFLGRNLVPFKWLDLDVSAQARETVSKLSTEGTAPTLPIVLLADGAVLEAPELSLLAGRIGLRLRAEKPFYDLVVVGGGPAGLAAAVYGASEGLRTLLVEREAPGGQAGTSSRIENYLGFPSGLTGADLTRRAVAQARKFGAELLTPLEACGLRIDGQYRVLTLSNGSELSTRALLIASGVAYRALDVPGAEALTGAEPRTEWVANIVQRDDHGFILTGPDLEQENGKPRGWPLARDPYLLETNVPGVFCAGDVRHQSVKRVASAVGEGSIAVQFTHRYLAEG